MDRFVAFLWDSTVESRTWQVDRWSARLMAQSPKWTTVLDRPGLRVHSLIHRGDAPIVTTWPDNDGIVIGVLFRRGDERKGRVKQLAAADAERIAASDGDQLVRDWWGNYVAIWRAQRNDDVVVLRDPCGAVPCFMTAQQDVQVLFAHAEDVAALPGVQFEIDWTYLQAFVFFNYFITEHTGLRNAAELLPGQRLHWSSTRARTLDWAWDAVDIAAHPHRHTADEAAAELRIIGEACVGAWGAEYSRGLISVSGGLDSSILLALLRRTSNIHLTAVHLRGVDYEDYEVRLARLAAAHANVELVETEIAHVDPDLPNLLTGPRTARPKLQLLSTHIDSTCVRLADLIDADAFFLGHGGDNLYLRRRMTPHSLTDYLYTEGPRNQFWRVAYEAAVSHDRSVAAILGETLHASLSAKKRDPYRMLNSERWAKHRTHLVTSLDDIPLQYRHHPWFAAAHDLPPGKADHLMQTVALTNYYLHHGRGVLRDAVYPHISQPIVELVLRTPTYVLYEQGADRAIARIAFHDLVPEEIARRTAKGGADHSALLFFQTHIGFFRDVILSGQLIKTGWFDIAQLERMLSPDHLAHGGGNLFVKLLAAAELWLAIWTQRQQRTA